MPDSSWRLDGSSIKATVWYKDNAQDKSRESILDLNRCCRVWNTYSNSFELSYIPRPDDLSKPNDDYLSGKLTEIDGMKIFEEGNGVLRAEHTPKYIFWKTMYTAQFDLKPFIRYSDDGHIEFVHK
ncbi:hypothetical protein AYO22_11401 [Fonsecaea multimorphosa]|nr:hypothetical protein AYO22_11401 [Fonsecaea multimorphosa]